MKKNILALLLATGVALSPAEAQKTKSKVKTKTVAVPAPEPLVAPKLTAEMFAQSITAADLSVHLHILASDEMEGRETGKKGQKMAAEYIAGHFREIGVSSPAALPQPYYQPFELEESRWEKAALRVDKTDLGFLKDFYLPGDEPAEQNQQLDLVFAGYGIETDKHSDYQNLDVKGKTVLVLNGEPKDAQGNFLVSGSKKPSAWNADYRSKLRLAREKGVKNLIIISDQSATQFQKQLAYLSHRLEKPRLDFPAEKHPGSQTPVVIVSQPVGLALLQTNDKKLQAYKNQVSKAGKPVISKFKPVKNAMLSAEKTRTPVPTENVLGFVEGTDKKDEILVITAHYDHVGMDPSLKGDQIFNGADDDGSGTSAILELAQAFQEAKKAGAGPRRSILFMTVTAEEKGLLGSEYYVNNPVFPLPNTVANLNIDMIGRLDKKYADNKNYIYVIGSDKLSSELHAINEEANAKHTNLKLDYTYNDEKDPNQFYYRSDHYNFAKNNIPVIFYFNGVHEDYHQPGDEVEKILFDKMETITRLVFHTAWEIANRDERIKVDSNKK
ncbi:M28 family peptidase [Adhaeribacter sp. BT258]|uniref:M28 family peptidase n=1 Tax=Adhaeribacter terrigena TaxID=2793070 RepID=A0ABS1C4J9_9BACT|nr:M28 family peptidase [Adhaeribacter terrigena]MBK0404314.1 M28 family peptidase [Adhaeribacter terrigena]